MHVQENMQEKNPQENMELLKRASDPPVQLHSHGSLGQTQQAGFCVALLHSQLCRVLQSFWHTPDTTPCLSRYGSFSSL